MHRRAPAATAALLSLALVTGCGGGSDDDAKGSEPSESASSPASAPAPEESETPTDTDFGAPAKGPLVKGDGYTYRMPAAWVNSTKQAKAVQKSIDSAAGEATFDDGFRDTVTVNFDRAPGSTLDDLEASVPDQLSEQVKKLDMQPHVILEGVETLHYRGLVVDGPSKYYLEQFTNLDDDSRITIITFSFSPDLPKARRDSVVNGVLASWKWTS
ncbi:hypothetical protein ncot_14370 [Nocardioides sp. JQ2195]|uniref:hypothetical protein n=1 Tax=Nocardioides sp. JQ2195 TaxID=2592334 RepID=UPI00143E3460|nr:hypothetical protein [Nocardioides sp. JQ2195]QIX27648.1 hypothetical protein ncot_14370 [Nocardioides sp. JQ2195]